MRQLIILLLPLGLLSSCSSVKHYHDEYTNDSYDYVEIKKGLKMVRMRDSSYHLIGSLKNDVIEPESGFYVKFNDGEIWERPDVEVRMGPKSLHSGGVSNYIGLGISVGHAVTTSNCTYVATFKLVEEDLDLFKTKVVTGFKVGPYKVKDFYKPGYKFRKRVNRLAGDKVPRWHE